MVIFHSYVKLPEGIQSRFGSADPTTAVWVGAESRPQPIHEARATAGMHERHEQDSKGREKNI